MWIYIGALLVLLLFGAVFFGAPYVPTHKADINRIFDIISANDVIMDLGSGDGVLLKAAAEKGIRSYGVELSLPLVFISWWRLRRYRKLARVSYGNYWRRHLPTDTTVVFVFLAHTYMEKLRRYLEQEAHRLGRPLTLISYGFTLPGYTPTRQHEALMVYTIKP